jgi:gamma-glutamyl-gamma-aminobutyrate hydrolase PuuD
MKDKKRNIIIVDSGFNIFYEEFIKDYLIKDDLIFEFLNIDDYLKSSVNTTPYLILFTGGEDVSTSFYGESRGKYTDRPNEIRDKNESLLFEGYRFTKIPKLGICRGGQLLCIKNGGKLIQHVEGHNQDHVTSFNLDIENINSHSLNYPTPSDHHQMMYPYNLKKNQYKILGWSRKYMSNIYLNGNNEQYDLPDIFFEPEVIYFPKTNSLSIQYHPEYSRCNIKTKEWTAKLINNTLFK